ncbi:MAG: hypothetical protein GX777_03025 [Fastidiosipila sp.]|nr:hypothetical protein [Fastidiosipila sp.]
MNLIDKDELLNEVRKINPIEYGWQNSYEEHTAFSIKLDIERLIEGMPTVQGIIKEEDMWRLP